MHVPKEASVAVVKYLQFRGLGVLLVAPRAHDAVEPLPDFFCGSFFFSFEKKKIVSRSRIFQGCLRCGSDADVVVFARRGNLGESPALSAGMMVLERLLL